MRQTLLISLAVIACALVFAAEPRPLHNIEILADVPSVAVAPRRPGRFSMRLPSLTYALTLTANCEGEWTPDSASISVADSRVSFGGKELGNGDALQFELQVPSGQIGPLRLEKFCVDENDPDFTQQDRITIPSVLSAQASLRCATDTAESIRYVTVPLDVSLECVGSEPADE
jgi:hypothetical protein